MVQSDKHSTCVRLLTTNNVVRVVLDPSAPLVSIPEHLGIPDELHLDFGLNLICPIPDLRVDDVGISGTLRFGMRPYRVFIPWGAIFAMAGDDGKGVEWPEDRPKPRPERKKHVREGIKSATRLKRALPEGWRVIK